MASPISPSAHSVQRDKTYYIHSGDVVFLVENILFRVHRFFFERESVFFQTLFDTPPPQNEPAPGSSDSSALILDQVTPAQFSRFVWVFYNPKFSLYNEASVGDWKSILELSNRWFFPEVKELATRELQNKDLSPVERIELYHRNSVDRNLLIPDYITLCQRPDPLSLNEGLELGLETTLMIARTREDIRSPRSPAGVISPLTPTMQGPELIEHIGKLFVASDKDSAAPNGAVVIGKPVPKPVPKPTIVINGIPDPNAGEKKSSGDSTPTRGGSTAKPQKAPKNQKTAKNNQATGKKKENQLESPTQNGPKATTKTSPTPETNKETGETANNSKEKNTSEDKGTETPIPVAGQQGAGAGSGGEENGGRSNNPENKEKSSKGDVGAPNEVKPEATDVGTEAGRKAGGTTVTAVGTQDAETPSNGGAPNGNTQNTNGVVDKNKTTDTQQTTTTTDPVGPSVPKSTPQSPFGALSNFINNTF